MPRQPLCRAHLIIPRKPTRAVSRKLYIVRRVGINKIARPESNRIQISRAERPLSQQASIGMKILQVVNCFVPAERHVELPTLIKATQTVITCPIQVIEEFGRLTISVLALCDQLVESITMTIENRFRVFHLDSNFQAALDLLVKVYEMRIDIVEHTFRRSQPERYSKPPAKRLHVATVAMFIPKWLKVGNQPTLPARPF